MNYFGKSNYYMVRYIIRLKNLWNETRSTWKSIHETNQVLVILYPYFLYMDLTLYISVSATLIPHETDNITRHTLRGFRGFFPCATFCVFYGMNPHVCCCPWNPKVGLISFHFKNVQVYIVKWNIYNFII